MAGKVRISKIEIGGGNACRVILSDGSELDGLQRVAPGAVSIDDILTVQIDAILAPFDDSARRGTD